MPILDQMVLEQNSEGMKWTPSKMIARLGKEINNPESVYYWAQKNHIPVLSPALTDGSLGDMIFFHSYKNPGLVLDIVEDLRLINTQAIFAKHSGMIILGGGVVKHHIANANLMVSGDGASSPWCEGGNWACCAEICVLGLWHILDTAQDPCLPAPDVLVGETDIKITAM
uniref:Deoxyhypusine synthase n=1 Tax=Rousettus aegyptiacus TaxID=9407 RepID=A0A7J8BRP3_ROUAE|nr:hypothetical protein HJG63_009584 [Rousettus aegyptiacus]